MKRLTYNEYLKSGHKLLLNEEGQRSVFEFLKENLKRDDDKSIWALKTFVSFIEGKYALINIPDFPDFFELKEKWGEIKKEAENCLRNNFNQVKNLSVRVNDPADLEDVLYALIKYTAKLKPDTESFTDIYILLAYNLVRNEELGSEDVETLIIKGFFRYNAANFVEYIRGGLNEKIEELEPRFPFYSSLKEIYFEMIEEGISIFRTRTLLVKFFLPLLFTDDLIYAVLSHKQAHRVDELLEKKTAGFDVLKQVYTKNNLSKFTKFIEERIAKFGIPEKELLTRIEYYLSKKLETIEKFMGDDPSKARENISQTGTLKNLSTLEDKNLKNLRSPKLYNSQ